MTLTGGHAEGGIAIDTVLVGKYRVESIVGRGGMGMVYRARHLALDEPVAVKVLRRDVSLDEETVLRFGREAQSAAKLRSEHVARIHDVGAFEDGLPYMVMEYLEGADLGQLVEQHGAMNPGIAVDLLLQACDAIAEAHSLGIVHRDIKPTNLFVSFRPDATAIVKVLDFGISKSANGTDLSLTQTASMLGTPAYMSPEQMRSARSVDARTDVWSLGCVLYELVESRRPFNAESFSEMCVMVAVDPPHPMTNARDLEPLIQRCLAKSPEQRFANVAELMLELSQFANNPDAARYYTTRAHRVLGLQPPAGRDSQTSMPRVDRGSAPLVPPPALPIAALTMHGQVARPPHTFNTQGPTRVEPVNPRLRPRRGWLVALIAILAIAGGAFAYVAAGPDDETAHAAAPREEKPIALDPTPTGSAETTDRAVTAGSADEAGSAALAEPPAMPDAGAAVAAEAGSAAGSNTGSAAGSNTGSAAQPTVTVSRPAKPPVRKPAKPPVTRPQPPVAKPQPPEPPPKPKCDPFDARVRC